MFPPSVVIFSSSSYNEQGRTFTIRAYQKLDYKQSLLFGKPVARVKKTGEKKIDLGMLQEALGVTWMQGSSSRSEAPEKQGLPTKPKSLNSTLCSQGKNMIGHRPEISQEVVIRVHACQCFRWLMTCINVYAVSNHSLAGIRAD